MRFFKFILTILIFSSFLSAGFAVARIFNPPLELEFPVSCQLEENCWFVNYPDEDLTKGIRDYKGGKVSRNGKKGIEIVVKTILEEMPVIPAENGEVVFIKNNVEDNLLDSEDEQKEQSFCGNYVIIEHNNGWKTLYCHLKKDSITVKPGDFAVEGKEIGQIGLSGQTEFPHLYFAVLHKGQYFDPFTGINLSNIKNKEAFKPFWSVKAKKRFKYKEIALINTGVSLEAPLLEKIKQGKLEDIKLAQDTPLFYLWMQGFHLKTGDYMKIKLENPSGEKILDKVQKISSNDLEQVVFFDIKKEEEEDWEIGVYKGKIEFMRPDKKVFYEYDVDFEIEKSQEVIDKELAEKEKLKKNKLIRKRKIKIFKRLNDTDKLPDSYTKNELRLWQ